MAAMEGAASVASAAAISARAAAKLERMAAKAPAGDIGDLARARSVRMQAIRSVPMSERLARVHALCKQMSAIKGAARAR